MHVYGKALTFVAPVTGFVTSWDKRYAVDERLEWAADSLILSLEDGAIPLSACAKMKALDYAIGSGLECVARMDIGRVKGLISAPETHHQKKRLCEIVRMLVGLRKSWQNWKLHEDVPSYRPSRRVSSPEAFF